MALQESTTRILFTEDSKPIAGLPIRFDGEDKETDAFGQVELALSEGHQTVEVRRNGSWATHVIEASPDSSLIIVDLAKRQVTAEREAEKSKSKVSFLDIGKLNLGDRYVYEEVIGRGGMSVVLKARDRLLNRDVAIKLLSQELQAHSEAQNVFLTEARNLARLSHPNLVAVHDICKVDDQVFMVIEFIEGESLGNLIDAVNGFSETVALQTVIQLSRVVGYLHAHGIIHRDLKPANAMIRNDGTLKLIDFGLARHFDELNVRGTRVRGTPAYMAPEQIRGDKLTPASDVYQLGVCMFEVVTGELPFSKGDVGYSHCHDQPPRANEINEDISGPLTELIDQCLQKDPALRPPDGQSLLKQLQTIYQAQDSSSGNILEQLRQLERTQADEEQDPEGYSNSELALMEGAGKHLRTSDFAVKQISKILSDPDMQSRIVIEQRGNSWFPIVGGILGGMIFAGGVWLASDRNAPPPQPEAAAETTAEISRSDESKVAAETTAQPTSDSTAAEPHERAALTVETQVVPPSDTAPPPDDSAGGDEPERAATGQPAPATDEPLEASEETTPPGEDETSDASPTPAEVEEKAPDPSQASNTKPATDDSPRSGGRNVESHDGSPADEAQADNEPTRTPPAGDDSEDDDLPDGFLH